ncbi:MAG: proton-conducting transporter membrane subunit [Pyrobaculum sp.]
MYSEVFLLATAVVTALSVLAMRYGVVPAAAAIAAMALYLAVGQRAVLATMPYIGQVAVALDVYKLPFVAVSIALGLLVTFYAPRYLEHMGAHRWYYLSHALYVLSFVFIIIFENLIFVFLALELSIITSFLLIWYFGYGNRRAVGLLYFIWAQVGSILFLIGVAMSGRFDAAAFQTGGLASLLVLLGLLIKMGTLGVHFWLPYAHAEAPTPLSALLSPVHVGLMAYWLWRLKEGAGWPPEALYIYGLLTAIYGSILVFREVDIKRALADSTIANMGLLVSAASLHGELGYWTTAILFTGHAFAKAAGFMLSGIYIVHLHTRHLDQLRWNTQLLTSGILTFVALSGVFGLSLVGKALLAIGAPHGVTAALVLIAALFSTALYNFYLVNRIYKTGPAVVQLASDMYIPTLLTAALPYVLLAALPLLWH